MQRTDYPGAAARFPNARHIVRRDRYKRAAGAGMRLRGWLALALAVTLGTLVPGHVAVAKSHRGVYRNIEVRQFDVAEGVAFPQEYMATLMGDVRTALAKLGQFEQVLGEGELPADSKTRTFQLTGTVVKYAKGSRFMRYMIGPASLAGPGKTKVVVELEYRDRDTGEVLHMARADGKVWIGFFGGNSMGATKGLAKEVAKVTGKKFL